MSDLVHFILEDVTNWKSIGTKPEGSRTFDPQIFVADIAVRTKSHKAQWAGVGSEDRGSLCDCTTRRQFQAIFMPKHTKTVESGQVCFQGRSRYALAMQNMTLIVCCRRAERPVRSRDGGS